MESLSNIARESKADVICLTETHCYGDKAPKLQGYSCYFRNRSQKSKGGLSILVFDKISKYVTKLETSIEPAEFFSLNFSCFDPGLVLTNFYGVIENQYTKSELLKIQSELFSCLESHANSGANIIAVGDFNVHVGEEMGLKGNQNKEISPGGRNLINWITENSFRVLNELDSSPTHFDCSTKSTQSNILDFAITNNMNIVKSFKVDSEKEFTPYRIKMIKGKRERVHPDHRSLIIKLSPNWVQKPISANVIDWNYSKDGGDTRYKELTDNFAGEFMVAIDLTESVDELYDWYLKRMNDIKMEAYGKSTVSIKRAEKIDDDKMWHKRLSEIRKSVSTLGK